MEVTADGTEPLVEWAVVRLRFTPHTATLGALVEEGRDQELRTLNRGLDLMLRFLDGVHCVRHVLTDLYGVSTAQSCGGCPACRRRGRRPSCPPLPIPLPTDTSAEQVVVADVPSPRAAASKRAFVTLMRRVMRDFGVHRFACASEVAPVLRSVFRAVADPSEPTAYRVDVMDGPIPFLLDPSEELVVLHVGELSEEGLRQRRGRVVHHLMTSDTAYLDHDERRPLEAAGAQFYPTPELWLQEKCCVHR